MCSNAIFFKNCVTLICHHMVDDSNHECGDGDVAEIREMRLERPRIPNDRPDLVVRRQCPTPTFGKQWKH